MLRQILINKTDRKVFALDENGDLISKYDCSTAYYPGYNEEGLPYSNAEDGLYEGNNVYAEIYNDEEREPAYGCAYINIDDRGRALHGGGSCLDDPYEDYQELVPTLGCFRMYNADIVELAQMFLDAESSGFKPYIVVES